MATQSIRSPRGALTERLALLTAVVATAALLVSALFLPSAVAIDRAVSGVQRTLRAVPPLPDDLEELAENSVVLAADGTRLAELHDVENRIVVSLDEVPRVAQNAVVATEDVDFWAHKGVNHEAIARALLTNIRSGAIQQGGSTITQQFVKNNLQLRDRTLDRKVKEALWAIELERRWSKGEILERYLNTAYFGEGVYGIGTAARFYFSKHVSELTLPEAALLAGLIRAPEDNNPVDDPDAALARRDIVIDQMAAAGFVTAAEAAAARTAPLELAVSPTTAPVEPFFVEWVKRVLYARQVDLQRDAQIALGDDEDARRSALFTGGLVIHTTLDPRLQDLADATITEWLDDPLTDPLASLVTVEPTSGAVRAMAVGPKAFGECPDGEPVCDRTKVIPAVPSAGSRFGRQPGSAFKPFVVAAALADGFSPGWEVETRSGQTIAGCSDGGQPYRPVNYAGGGGGYLNMYDAVRRSSNVYHVKLAEAVGVDEVAAMARRLGIERSENLDEAGCSIALGTPNVYPLEMAAAYSTLANRGVRCAPFVIERIEDRAGNLLYQHSEQCERVLERGIADRVTDILQGPPGPGGTASYVRGALGRPVAGKTGTTNDFKDAWFVGYVPQYVTAAWVGHEYPACSDGITMSCGSLFGVEARGSTYRRVTGGSIPGRMWADYMAEAVEGLPVERFPTPPPVPTVTVPDVVGAAQDEASRLLDDRGFTAVARSVVHHAAAGTVVAQQPAAGSDAWAGSVVTIEVSDGTGQPPLPTVPDVVGMTEEEARAALVAVGYDVRVVKQPTSDPTRDGRVVGQSPPAGTEYEAGRPVIITVARHGPDGAGRGGNPRPPGPPGAGRGGATPGGDDPSPSPSDGVMPDDLP